MDLRRPETGGQRLQALSETARCIYLFVSVVTAGSLLFSIVLLKMSDICLRMFQ